MHKWIGITFFSRREGHIVSIEEMKLMYAMIKKCKISSVRLMVTFWAILHTLRGPIIITSWITRLAGNLNLLGNASITYISTPRRSFDIYFFSQAHLLKQKGNRIFVTYKGFINEYELPNISLGLYVVGTFLVDLQRLTRELEEVRPPE
jgi:hypothetical protein